MKVLVITYYWPPAGGPGVQRWLSFVKYLPDFGITPVVYAPQNPHYPITDNALENNIPDGITIIKQPIFEPYGLASTFSKKKTKQMSSGLISAEKQSFTERILLWIRGNFFIPDARKFWVKPSVKFLSDYIEKEKIDMIITTGPPHSLHLIGLQLKKRTGVKWLADFRDPWTTIGYHHKLKLTRRSQRKHEKLEKEVLNSADRIVVTSPTTKKEFQELTNVPVSVITNGYDQHHIKKTVLHKRFTLSHIGSLLTGRNPEMLWEALSELIAENEEFKNNFELLLAGTVSRDVLETIYSHQLKKHTKLLGYLSHDEAQQLQHASQLLLLIEINSMETRCIIPGKLFEYMRAQRPILAIGPEGWDVETIIKKTNTGSCFTYDQKTAVKKKIVTYFEDFKAGNLNTKPIGLEQYSRKNLTEKLTEIISNL